MFRPDDPLAPREKAFSHPWQAQALAIADSLVKTGRFSARDWAEALGAALQAAGHHGEPDDTHTYYSCVIEALESLTEAKLGIAGKERKERSEAWKAAYLATPHGHPVELRNGLHLAKPGQSHATRG